MIRRSWSASPPRSLLLVRERRVNHSGLREVRRVLRGRQNRADAGDVSYRLYMAVMLVIVVVAPVVRVGVLGLAEGHATIDPGLLAAALTAATALLALAGAQGGPAYAGLAPLDLLFTTAIPRRSLLARPVVRGLLLGAAVGLLGGALAAVARAMRDDVTVELALALLVGGTAVGLFAAFGMLLGQLGRATRWVLAGVLTPLLLGQLLWGFRADPWSWVASLALGGAGGAVGAGGALPPAALLLTVAMLLASVLLALVAPRIAALLRWETLREQAARWDAIHVTAGTGDPKAALDRMGAPVRVGRRWRLRPAHNLTLAILRRDALGMLRTPARTLLGLAGMVAALGLWWVALGVGVVGGADPDPVRAGVLGGLSMLTASLSMQPWCRGLAAAAEGVGSPPLLPLSPQGLLVRHLVAPLGLGVLTSVCAAAGLSVFGGVVGGAFWGAACSSVVLVCGGLALRLLASLKGSIPLRLLAPIPTPAGDASGIQVALWMADGPVMALLSGALLGVLWAFGLAGGGAGGVLIWAVIVSAVVIAGMVLWARGRLAR